VHFIIKMQKWTYMHCLTLHNNKDILTIFWDKKT